MPAAARTSKTNRNASSDPVTTYAHAILSGAIPACKWIRLACQRHIDDLAHGAERGLRFDLTEAQLAIDFFPDFLVHTQGDQAGRPFVLELWQQFAIGSVFGWRRADGTRRFRTVYESVSRKNGKTTKVAGVGLECLIADDEPGAECYSAATQKSQARKLWSEAEAMVKASTELQRLVVCRRDNLHILATRSKFEPLGETRGNQSSEKHGLNVHFAGVDELHAHRTRSTVDVISSGRGSRRQPLVWYITTAGEDATGICFELEEYSQKVLDAVVSDDSWFALIFTIDDEDAEGDRWQDERCWIKANPNLGVSKKLDYMRDEARKASVTPAAKNGFFRFELNRWTSAISGAVSAEQWKSCRADFSEQDLYGKTCYLGLDFGGTQDFMAAAALFPMPLVWRGDTEVRPFRLLTWFWTPQDTLVTRAFADGFPYDQLAASGQIFTTPGRAVKREAVRNFIRDHVASKFQVREIAYDPYDSHETMQFLADEGFTTVEVRQGFSSISAPTKDFIDSVQDRLIEHNGHPLMTWMVSNLSVEMDYNGNKRPSKKASKKNRIDGPVAAIIALKRAVFHPKEDVPMDIVVLN